MGMSERECHHTHFVRFERFYLMKEYDLVAIEAKLKQN
jgi:hypothetical protein